jgi:hypothetical protein
MEANAKIVSLCDSLLTALLEAGEATVKHVHCKAVVPHAMNRGGAAMEVSKVFDKGSKILGVGFSLTKCDPSRAICFQPDPIDDRSTKKCLQQASKCDHLANFDTQMIEGCSVGCGHLNQFSACKVSRGRSFCIESSSRTRS